jgi:microsomal dipeptidase-like Zn-dependent dipeptidase
MSELCPHLLQVIHEQLQDRPAKLGGLSFPQALKDASDLPNITVELMARGYSDEETGGVVVGRDLGPR